MKVNLVISSIRKKFGYSQDEVASRLGMSRQTYMKIEKDGSQITTAQLESLAKLFGMQVSEFFYEVPDTDKFKQMYKYILSKFPEHGVPKTKLAKLLYLSDFHHFYDHLEPMSGVSYKCKEYGPLADPFLELTDDMFDSGEIRIRELSQGAQMISLSDSLLEQEQNLLSDEEMKEMDEICEAWKDANTQTIVNFTHHQKPWMACRPNEIIPYELILQEDPDHVYTPTT